MRLLRMRFSLRRAMIAVALIALVFKGTIRPEVLHPVEATSSDPKVAIRQEKVLAGVLWGLRYEEARERSESEGKPILVYFGSVVDVNSRIKEVEVLPRTHIVPLLARFMTVRLDLGIVPIRSLTESQCEAIAEKNQELQGALIAETISPKFVALNARGKVLATLGFTEKPSEFAGFLDRAQARYRRRSGGRDTSGL